MEEEKKEKRKKSKLLRFFLVLVIILIGVPLIAELVFFLMRIAPGSVIPDSFAAYVHSEKPLGLAEKVLDHESLPALMANPALAPYAPMVHQLRESGMLSNPWIRMAVRGSLSAALTNQEGTFIAAWDSGLLAPFLKLLPFIVSRFSVPDLYYVQGAVSRFEYRSGETVIYITSKRNLIIVSNDEGLFSEALQEASFSPGKSLTLKKSDLSLLLSSKTVVSVLSDNNPLLTRALGELEFPSFIELGLTVEHTQLTINLASPLDTDNEAFSRILKRNSQAPSVMGILPDTTQYFTSLSAGSLEELLAVMGSITEDELGKTLDTANKASRALLGLTVEDILFSWSGSEFAAFGLEERPAPIFAVKIEDEKKRQEVFDKAFRSFFVNEDARLVLDGNRIPQIRLPGFLEAILRILKVEIPSPYYTVHEGWLLISESPENLVAAVDSLRKGDLLPKSDTWRRLSSTGNDNAALSLFYSLNRSLPFFLKGGSPAASILRMYRQGLLRLSIKDSVITLTLSVIPGEDRGVEPYPGYPLTLGGKAGNRLYSVSNNAGTESRILLSRGNTALAINPADRTIYELPGDDPVWVIPAAGLQPKNMKESAAWVLSSKGLVTLVNGGMEAAEAFPVITGLKPVSEPAAHGGKLYISVEEAGERGAFYTVDTSGKVSRIPGDLSSPVLSPPVFIEKQTRGNRGTETIMAFYPKSFLGEIHQTDLEGVPRYGWPVYASGIAFGSPVLFQAEDIYTAFITMAGELSVFTEDGSVLPSFPLELTGVFYLQPVWDGEYLWLASEEGTLYQIDLHGTVKEQRVPNLTVQEDGAIMVQDTGNDSIPEVFITGEGNALYGYSRNLNSLEVFPLPVWGKPVFADFDGDGRIECVGVGMDNKLYRWQFKN